MEYLPLDMIIWKFLVSHVTSCWSTSIIRFMLSVSSLLCCLWAGNTLGEIAGEKAGIFKVLFSCFPIKLFKLYSQFSYFSGSLVSERSSGLYCSTTRRGNGGSQTKSFGVGCMSYHRFHSSFSFFLVASILAMTLNAFWRSLSKSLILWSPIT